jgi:hypothetical protein
MSQPTCPRCGRPLGTLTSYSAWRSPRLGTVAESVTLVCVNNACPTRRAR